MIRIYRSPDPPKSLEKEIKKKNGSYRKQDVHDKLKENFHNKCYICETKPMLSRDIDHLKPHLNAKFGSENWEIKFAWDNLFLSCHHCNMLKSDKENILNCCERDPEQALYQKVDGGDVSVSPIDPNDQSAAATAQLIQEAFMATKPPARKLDAADRRGLLHEELMHLLETLDQYKKCRRKSKKKAELFETLRQMVQLDQAYAGFLRTEIREIQKLQKKCPELKELLVTGQEQSDEHTSETEVPV